MLLVCTILFWGLVVDALSCRWPWFSRLVKARARPLIQDGELNPRTMRRELMSGEEVVSQLRLHGTGKPEQVARAFMEPHGVVSIVRREDEPDGPDAPQKPFIA